MEDSAGEASTSTFRLSLTFKSPAVEGEYLMEVAKSRWPVLTFIFCFDVACYLFRFAAKLVATATSGVDPWSAAVAVSSEVCPQLANMALLYTAISLLNRRSRKHGDTASRQEELLLSVLMAMAICNLLASLGAGSPQDYVYAAFFLICTSTFLKIRWWVGTLVLATPVVLLHMWQHSQNAHVALPPDALVHILVAWAVGGLMAYLAEWYRRQMFSSQCIAASAHQKELLEAQARIRAQRQLAAAQAQAAQRALAVARDKAAHEAQIEFMSLMCHEVRTPLNGCLASAEMLLETQLCSEQRELANTIKVSGSILLSTVSNFLDFFKMEAGKTLDIVRAEVDLLQLVHDVHCIIEAMVGRNGSVRLLHPELVMSEDSVGPGGQHHIICDPDRVRGVLLNLYTNAAKFTKQGHIGLRVQEVCGQHEPDPGEGYGKITVTPAYQPGSRSHSHRAAAFSKAVETELLHDKEVLCTGDVTPAEDSLHAGGAAADLSDCTAADHQCLPVNGSATLAPEQPVSSSGPGAVYPGSSCPSDRSSKEEDTSRWLLFEVMDTGVGITQEGLQALFKEYCQGTEDDMRKPRSKGGTGLGLSICSKQVAVLGGRIGAYSSPDKGSVFWFTIPLILPSQPSGATALQQQPHQHSRADPLQSVSSTTTVAQVRGQHSIILQSHPGASHQYAVSHSLHATPPAHIPRISQVHCTPGQDSRHSHSTTVTQDTAPQSHRSHTTGTTTTAARCHHSLRMPPHFTMDVEQDFASPVLHSVRSTHHHAQPGDSSAQPSHCRHSGSDVPDPLNAHTTIPAPGGPAPCALQLEPSATAAQHVTHDIHDIRAASQAGAACSSVLRPSSEASGPGSNATAGTHPSTSNQHTALPPQEAPPSDQSAHSQVNVHSAPDMGSMRPAMACPALGPCSAPPALGALRGRRVLLVEDNLINQTVARKMLAGLGMQCTVASNGLEAVKAVEAAVTSNSQGAVTFDVILMDMMMPVMGGVDATRQIRQLEATLSTSHTPASQQVGDAVHCHAGCSPDTQHSAAIRVPILAMTANASDRDREECRAAGMDGFLSKPVLKDRLAEAIVQVLTGSAWAPTVQTQD